MQQVLQSEYDIAPRWIEDAALTTWDNARLSAPLLKAQNIRRIVLVTHAWHLRRAVPLFEVARASSVIPAGIQFSSTQPRLHLRPPAHPRRPARQHLRPARMAGDFVVQTPLDFC